jgi:chromosome segregation ATPase
MKRASIGIVAFAFGTVLAQPVAADEARTLVDTIVSGQAELGEARRQLEDLDRVREDDRRAHAPLQQTLQQTQRQIDDIERPAATARNRRLAGANQLVENWNAECALDRVGRLPKAAYERCARLRPEVQRTVDAIRGDVARQKGESERTLAPLRRRERELRAAIGQADRRAADRSAQIAGLREGMRQREARLEETRRRLHRVCDEATNRRNSNAPSGDWREALHHCNSVRWDATKRTLPPLLEIRRPFSVTPN